MRAAGPERTLATAPAQVENLRYGLRSTHHPPEVERAVTAPAVRRGVAVLAGLALAAVPALPALALSDGEEPGPGLGLVETLGIFVGIPLALFCLIALLAVASGLRHRPRYRPGRPWDHGPVWFAGPTDPDSALVAARPGPGVTGGGASAEW